MGKKRLKTNNQKMIKKRLKNENQVFNKQLTSSKTNIKLISCYNKVIVFLKILKNRLKNKMK